MNRERYGGLVIPLVLLAAISGCAHVISPEIRQQVRPDLAFATVLQNPEAYMGEVVIWGGVIIDTTNQKDGTTTLKILETPLDPYGMPGAEEYSQGRFIAKAPRYLDPEIYRKGRRVTLAGDIVGTEVEPLGETEYNYPVVSVKEIHLWRKYPYSYYNYYDPYWGDYWYWHGYPYPYYLPYFQFHFYHHWH